MGKKREVFKCEVCKQNRINCKRRLYGYEGRFYLVCEECREEMKLTSRIISITAREIVKKKPYEFQLLIKKRKIFGITPCVSRS